MDIRIIMAALTTASLLSGTGIAQANTCSDVLVSQVQHSQYNNDVELAWLSIIDHQNYNQAKQSGGAKYLDLFSGSFSNFASKRERYLSQRKFTLTQNEAEEVFKSYLSDQQISAWLECKRSNQEIALYAKNPDKFGATIVINWPELGSLGALKDFKVTINNAQVTSDVPTGDFSGSERLLITRIDPDASIRGVVRGNAGVNRQTYSADIYIPEHREPPLLGPTKVVVSLNGKVKTSTAYWAGGGKNHSWDCMSPSSGMDYVEDTIAVRNLGKRRGQCVNSSQGKFCDSTSEFCRDMVITKGCLVNTEWHDWYKAKMKSEQLPYSKDAACSMPE